MLDVFRDAGFRVAAEAFADRRYEPDGSLRSRKFADALIRDPAEAAQQALRIAEQGSVLARRWLRSRRDRTNNLHPRRYARSTGNRRSRRRSAASSGHRPSPTLHTNRRSKRSLSSREAVTLLISRKKWH